MTLPPLTARQNAVYEFIREFTRKNGYGPGWADFMAAFGFKSKNAVTCYVRALQKKGYVAASHNKARSVVILGADPRDELLAECAEVLAESNPELAGRINTTILGRRP